MIHGSAGRAKLGMVAMLCLRITHALRITSMAILSLFCSLLLFLTGWAVVPFFVLGPLAIWFAHRSYQASKARYPRAGHGRRLLARIPMVIAIAIIPATLAFINATYRA